MDFLFFAVLAFGFCCDGGGYLGLTFLCAIAHEAGHIFAMLLCGVPPVCILFEPFGAAIKCPGSNFLPEKLQIVIFLTGAFVNFALAGIAFLMFGECPFFWINAALGIFNLLPIAPLDGANALECLLGVFLGEKRANLYEKIISAAFLLPFAIFAFSAALKNKGNFSVLFVCLYLCGIFLADCGVMKGNKNVS
ncbi:MAG: site-2 protease family protein [Clostridia bacterium]|nr:site-2 protease family protein [Clostridia bacterium]